MEGFLLTVASTMAAAAITAACGWLLSARLRGWILTFAASLAGLGVLRVYRRQGVANGDLAVELRRAHRLYVLAGRGNELTRDAFATVWSRESHALEAVRILLPDPEGGPGSWLADREAEIGRTDPGFHSGLLTHQVRTNAAYLAAAGRGEEHIAVRYYDLPHLCRIVATENVAFLTLYREAEHGRNSPCILARNPGVLYDFALRTFHTAWRGSRPATPGHPAATPGSSP